MAFTFTEQFYVIDPVAPPPAGTTLTVHYFSVTDRNNDGHIHKGGGDSIDGVDIVSVHSNDTVTVVDVNGNTITYTGVTFYLADGRAVFTPTDLQYLANAVSFLSSTFSNSKGTTSIPSLGPPVCFAKGTLISTTKGERPVENLRPGDRLITSEGRIVTLVLPHMRVVSGAHLADNPKHCPIHIRAGSLGNALPVRDLIVSPQHRMLIRSDIVERMFGTREVLVPACQLVGWPGIERISPASGITYVHLLTKEHNVIIAEGAPSETLFLGEQAVQELPAREITSICRRLGVEETPQMEPARLFVRGKKLRKLLLRHSVNKRPLLQRVEREREELTA